MKKHIFYTAILLLVVSCARNVSSDVDGTKPITIDVNKALPVFDMSGMVDTSFFRIIPLETSPECLISEITKIFFTDGKIYVFDQGTEGIYTFDNQGHFLNKIQNRGAGPKEYVSVFDAFIDGKNIYVDDVYGRKVLVYDISGGFVTVISKDKTKIWSNYIFAVEDKIFYVNDGSNTGSGCYVLFSSDKNGGNINSYIPFECGTTDVVDAGNFTVSDNGKKAFIAVNSDDTIYEISDEGVKPVFKMDFSGKKMPEEYAKENAVSRMKQGLYRKYTSGIEGLVSSDNELFMKFNLSGNTYNAIYDLNTDSVFVAKSLKINSIGMSLQIENICQGNIVGQMSASECSLFYKSAEMSGKSEIFEKSLFGRRFKEIARSISTDDNPVVFIYKLKR